MKRKLTLASLAAAAIFVLTSQTQEEPIMWEERGMTAINTATLATDVEGYAGATPVIVYIKNDKVERVEPLPNEETPKYFALMSRKLLGKWKGMTAKKAETAKVDAVTGATMSSDAGIENVRRGVAYYNHFKR